MQELKQISVAVSKTSIPPDADPQALEDTERLLRACADRTRAMVLRIQSNARGPLINQACEVARVGLSEAESTLEGASAESTSAELRVARHKLFLALSTVRHTLTRMENARVPLWRALSPALGARRAAAEFRETLEIQQAQGDTDQSFRLFMIQSQLELLQIHPSLTVLSHERRTELARLAILLRDERDVSQCFARSNYVVRSLIAELNERSELRCNDELILRSLQALLVRDCSERGLRESAKSLLFAARGLDVELDSFAARFEENRGVDWLTLFTRAAELLTERFDDIGLARPERA